MRTHAAWPFTALLVAAACAPSDRADPNGGTITVLDPAEVTAGPGWSSQHLVFLPLVGSDEHGEREGRLARRWEPSPDFRRWTYHLRTDVRWHDGHPVTAHDVEFTLRLLAHPDVLYLPPELAGSVTVVNDSTIVTEGIRNLDTWLVYFPRHLLEGLDTREFWEWEFWRHPVGNGPYRVARHAPRLVMELEANADDYRGRPRIQRVVLKAGGATSAAALTELMAGTVDASLSYTNPVDLYTLASDPNFRVYYSYGDGTRVKAVAWNHRVEAFRDAGVRRALTLAIDRRELLRTMSLPDDLPVPDAPFSDRQLRAGSLAPAAPYDRDEAGRLLDEAGWREPTPGAVRVKAGTPLRFAMLVSQPDQNAAVYIQAGLRRVGVDPQVHVLDASALQRRVAAGDFDATLVSLWNIAGGSPRGFGLVAWFGDASPLGYHSPTVARLADSLAAALDPAEQDALYRRLAPLFQADLPVTYLYPQVRAFVAHRRVQGLRSPYRANPVEHMEKLWLEDGR